MLQRGARQFCSQGKGKVVLGFLQEYGKVLGGSLTILGAVGAGGLYIGRRQLWLEKELEKETLRWQKELEKGEKELEKETLRRENDTLRLKSALQEANAALLSAINVSKAETSEEFTGRLFELLVSKDYEAFQKLLAEWQKKIKQGTGGTATPE
eukprot:TRINITY_DN106013_c0_g1_i1.p1 TRINITY_DN106013_c0_g1~~TRINITY_DN106013_c0_g1_i1.p1  ORF type:complete len:154 (-),score=13.53 TRINITY_DN106013_c0_g1_i1:227-688(-)